MNQKFDILSPSGTKLREHTLSANCVRKFSLMSEDSITLRFWTREAMDFPVGSSVGDFFITRQQVGKWNASTGVYDYELKFDAYYWTWANKILRYIIPGIDSAKETSFSLTATIDIHANVIKNCLDFLGFRYNGSPFRIDTTDTSLSLEAKLVRYENLSLLGGIQEIAEAFDCEWWVDGNAVYFGRCENSGSKHVFEAGINTSSISFNQGKTEAPNRIYVYGSNRNLPANYRKIDGNDTIGGVVARRLMLPEGIPYLQTEENIPESQIVEKVVVLDCVYPKTDLIITEEPEIYTSDTKQEDGSSVKETYYRINYNPDFFFSNSYILPDGELQIVFESGLLNGMDFGLKFNPKGAGEKKDDGSWNPEAQMFEIVVNEDYGRKLPDTILKPQKGDRFIIYGWDSTKMADLGLIASAEQELLNEGRKALEEYSKDLSTCTCPMAWDYMKPLFKQGLQPMPGDVVTIMDTVHFGKGGRKSRIIGYEYKLDKPYAECIYTCGENISVKRLDSIEQKIEGLAKTGTKVQVQNSLDFLSKRYADRTPYALSVGGRLTAEADAGSKVFVDGPAGLGKGWTVDQQGNIVGESLRLRSFLEVPELRFNRVEVMAGNFWHAPGGGEIERVEPDTDADGNVLTSGTAWLKLEDGEAGAVAQDDYCYGVWHFSGADSGLNATDDADDGRGNFRFRGFATIYFRITDVSPDLSFFRYQLRPGQTMHPQGMMSFVGYGNATKKDRQASRYSTRSYERYLIGVTDWEFGAGNVAAQFGDLSNLNLGGRQLEGYSAFLRNLYMTGTITQNIDEPLRLEITAEGAIGSDSGDITLRPRLMRGTYILRRPDDPALRDTAEDPLRGVAWLIERETGDGSADSAWSAGKQVGADGEVLITRADFGGAEQALFVMTATLPERDEETGEEIVNAREEATSGIVLYTRDALSGADGATLSSYAVEYAVTATDSTADRDKAAWTADVPAIPEGHWLWTRKTEVWSDGKRVVSYSVSRNGRDGESSLLLDLDNEIIAIPLDAAGKAEKAMTYTTGARVFHGTKDVTAEASLAVDSHSFGAGCTVTAAGGVLTATVPEGHVFPDSTPTVQVTATWQGRTLRATWAFYTVRPGLGRNAVTYDLLTDPSQFSRLPDGTLSPSGILTVKVLKHDGNDTTELTPSQAAFAVEGKLEYVVEGVTNAATAVPDSGIEIPQGATAVQIALTTKEGLTLDRERVPVVRDGADGKDGSSYTENLLVGTKGKVFERIQGQYGAGALYFAEEGKKWEVGDKYTLSFDYEYSNVTTNGNGYIGFQAPYRDHGGWQSYIDGSIYIDPNTSGQSGKGKLVKKGTIDYEQNTELVFIGCYILSNSTSGTVRIWNVKLERGHNDNPVWTPHPDDLKGEDGEDGNGIDKVTVRYHFAAPATNGTAPSPMVWDPNGNSLSSETYEGAVLASGLDTVLGAWLWVRKVTTYTKSANTTEELSVSRVAADGGQGNGIHLAYSRTNPLDLATKQGWLAMSGTQLKTASESVGFSATMRTDSAWLGIYTDNKGLTEDSDNPGDYGWVRIKGEDGKDGSSYTENLLRNSKGEFVTETTGDGDHYKIFRDTSAYLEQGKEYTISARTNAAQFGGAHGASFDHCCLWLCSLASSPQGTVNDLIGHTDMATDGSKGHSFTWNYPTGEYFIRTNFYTAGSWWVSHVKIELGNNEHPVWTPHPDDLKGDPGEPGVTYALTVTPDVVKSKTERIYASVTRQQGDSSVQDITGRLLDQNDNFVNEYGLRIDCDGDSNDLVNGNGLTFDDFPATISLKLNNVTIASKTVTLVSDGKPGGTGPAGKTIRWTQWVQGVNFCNNSTTLDCVVYGYGKSRTYWKCGRDHTSSADRYPGAPSYPGDWEQMNAQDPIYTAFILAENARIEMMNGQEIIFASPDGKMHGRIGTEKDGTIYWAGRPKGHTDDLLTAEQALYRQYANGMVRYGAENGQKVIIDPTEKELRFYDPDGAEAATHSGRTLIASQVVPSSGSNRTYTMTRNRPNLSFNTYGTTEQVFELVECTGYYYYDDKNIQRFHPGVEGNGVLNVSLPQLEVKSYCPPSYNSSGDKHDQQFGMISSVSSDIRVEILAGKDLNSLTSRATRIVGTTWHSYDDGDTHENTIRSMSLSCFLSDGEMYRVVLRVEARMFWHNPSATADTAKLTVRTPAVTSYNDQLPVADYVFDFLQCHYGKNGFALSKNSNNFFYALFEDGLMNFESVRNGFRSFPKLLYNGTIEYRNGVVLRSWEKMPFGSPKITKENNYFVVKFPAEWSKLPLYGSDSLCTSLKFSAIPYGAETDTLFVGGLSNDSVIIAWKERTTASADRAAGVMLTIEMV